MQMKLNKKLDSFNKKKKLIFFILKNKKKNLNKFYFFQSH
jgi:hypothetical protein